ncbi:MAG: GNAT family N-acetyltransferase [Gemmatimonadaceae bacterium]|nr:GNAT family N-acetyltransferase [Gemmatimonadaceae bacterium]
MTEPATRIGGPFPIKVEDIAPLNELFSEAFSERYRRDGMSGVRVPPLNPAIWRFALESAGEGAMLWRDGAGALAAFNLAHASGREGWMGPLAVRDDLQGRGLGATIVRAGIEHLRRVGCTTIGLETMPRTMDNIGFYAGLGFLPAPLTITVTMDGTGGAAPPELLGRLGAGDRERSMNEMRALTERARPGADYTREVAVSLHHAIGDVVLHRDADRRLRGFALYHDVPLVEGRSREELRVLKLVAASPDDLMALVDLVRVQARRSGALRAAFRVQGEFSSAFRVLVAHGARVRWTDLRMTLTGAGEASGGEGIALSNWEI